MRGAPATACPDWRSWLAEETGGAALSEAERTRVVDHLRSCGDCRRRAEEADPTLLFLGLEPVETTPAEVESIRHAVGAMRRTRHLETGRPAARGRFRRAVAAGFLLTALLLLPGSGGNAPPADPVAAGDAVAAAPAPGPPDVAAAGASVIENLDRPGARIYQLTENDLSLVMIVDESLDL